MTSYRKFTVQHLQEKIAKLTAKMKKLTTEIESVDGLSQRIAVRNFNMTRAKLRRVKAELERRGKRVN